MKVNEQGVEVRVIVESKRQGKISKERMKGLCLVGKICV